MRPYGKLCGPHKQVKACLYLFHNPIMVFPEKDNLDEEGNETLGNQDNSHESDDDDSENDDELDAKSKRHKEQME